jgi:class 3 adenylate cyclase/predicted ATPase
MASDAVAERRHLTVLFCDLVTSTELATQLDPETYREVIRAYHAACAAVIERMGGYIAQYLGDGLLVYFGYPVAHEDDPQRAVRAGLGLVEAVHRLRTPSDSGGKAASFAPLQVRIGIHTGLVVIGDVGGGGRQERLALGDVPNLAARLQNLATPGAVVISAATQRLVEGWFLCQSLGRMTLAGFPHPVAVYLVAHESGAHSRLDITASRGLTPLVGREQEVAFLRERWARVKDGLGQVVLLSGEAGIGKSRLVHVLMTHMADDQHFHWDARCSSSTEHSALFPVIELFRRMLDLRDDDTPAAKRSKLEGHVAPFGLAPEVMALLASLLSIPSEELYPALAMTPALQKQKTFEALLLLLRAMAAQQPVLIVVEDIHWADPSTLEFLNFLVGQLPGVRALTILVSRPEFRAPWSNLDHLSQLTLARLSHRHAEMMVTGAAANKLLPGAVIQQVVTRTDGVPLFVEELTKMLLESGWLQEREGRYELPASLPPAAIPATLSDLLMARLDRLGAAKPVAQLGAVIGRQFSYELLRAVSPLDETMLGQALGRLVDAQMLYQHGLPPQATYTFKHVLIQEAAYESLLKSTRQQHHHRIVQALAAQFPTTAATRPELFAHHYSQAGLVDQALPYWLRAGQRAVQRSANTEAIRHLSKGLDLLETLPSTPERVQQELAFHLAVGAPLLMIKGNTAPEVERVYVRAQELCEQLGDSPQLVSTLIGLWRFALNRARLLTARALADQCFSIAQRLPTPVHMQEAHLMVGSTLVYLGQPAAALPHLEQSIAHYDPQHNHALTFVYGTDPRVVCLARLAWALWLLGYPDQALIRVTEALTLAKELSHTYSLAFAMHYKALVHLCRREALIGQEIAETQVTLSRKHGFAQWVTGGTFLRGWALVERGDVAEGIAQLREAQATWQAMGTELARTHISVRLAEAYWKSDQIEAGLEVVADGLDGMAKNAEHYYEAELHRLQGELLLRQASLAERSDAPIARIEACFHRALDIARHQEAKSLELRALISLCRLWQRGDRRADAHRMLADMCGRFTEGGATVDLREATSLLTALA